MTDILDIAGIVSFPWGSVLYYGGIALGVLALAALFYFLIHWIKKWRQRKAERNLPAHERFALEIERLEQQNLLETRHFRKHYFFLSDIFRVYLLDRYGYPAIDKTTNEIIPELSNVLRLSSNLQHKVVKFFNSADLIKFANFIPSESVIKTDKENIVRFVELTKKRGVELEG